MTDYAEVISGRCTHGVQGTRDITVGGAETHTRMQDNFAQKMAGNFTLTVDGDIASLGYNQARSMLAVTRTLHGTRAENTSRRNSIPATALK